MAQSPTDNTLPNWKRSNKAQNENTKTEQDKKSTQFKVSETAKPILEEQALLKEKLRSQLTWKKDKENSSYRRKAQPMVARPPSPGAQKQTIPQSTTSTKPPSPPPTRRRTHSPSSSFSAGTSRSSSPLAEISPEFKRNIEKATRARLYLLQQVGPNSFMIGGDSPNHKFKVIIGPQTCTCGKVFCVHLLFVMLRVFKVKENDPLLWNNNLRNYEVEGLFSKFHARVNSRLAKNSTSNRLKGRVRSPHRRTPPPSPIGSIAGTSEPSTSGLNKDDEEVCPICLLEMVEGESLTCCKGGCNNRLHQHCMEIWAVECKARKERLNCPLCRRILTPDAAPFLGVGDRSPKTSPLSPNRTVSPNVPTPLGPEEVITLPHSEPIPPDQIDLARPWIQVLGESIVSCMFSREWSIRETALRRLSKDLDSILTSNGEGSTSVVSLEACCSLLSMMCGDPVYKVYVAALRTFRVMLGLTKYSSDEDKVSLQALFRRVIEAIMTKCSDGNRRISALSIKVLIEICKDQNGELALGRMIGQDQHQSLGGLGYMLTCVLTTAHEYATWPWWLGRLHFLHRLLEEYIDSFELLADTPDISLENSVGVIVQEGDHVNGNEIYSDNMTRLMSVLRFAILAGQCSHTMVSKKAITILLCCTSLAANCPSAFVHIKKLVSKLKPSQRSILQRRLATLSRTTSVETSEGDSSPLSEVSAAILDNTESVASEMSSGYFSANRIESTSTTDENDNLSETELLQSLVESLKRPNFLCLNLPRNVSSPSRDLELLDWSRSENASPRLPAVVVDNKCQKKIEEEENEAVARAMEVSVQSPVPQTIPSLRPSVDEDEMVIVYTQPESMDKAVNNKHLYMENIHWKKGDLLGTGAFSSCYAARDVFNGSLMAVKQVSFCRNSKGEQEKVCQSILDEINLLGRLQHPHLIKCLGATKHTGHFNIFLEWMAGGSISMLLSKYGAFEQATLVRYTRQILQGVAYLHQNQVIHRDIKGANILVDSTGQNIRIADFGAAARLATQITGAGEFQGQLLGTIAFMAPEVLRGESYGRSCDVWSVGCLLVEMATGKPPWNAHEHSNHLALIFKIACATAPPEIPDYLNPAVRDVLLRCFEHKPEDRPPAMELLKHPLFTQVIA